MTKAQQTKAETAKAEEMQALKATQQRLTQEKVLSSSLNLLKNISDHAPHRQVALLLSHMHSVNAYCAAAELDFELEQVRNIGAKPIDWQGLAKPTQKVAEVVNE